MIPDSLQSSQKSLDKDIAMLTWIDNEFSKILQEAVSQLSTSGLEAFRWQQQEDLLAITSSLKSLNGLHDWNLPNFPVQHDPMKALCQQEVAISAIADELGEWMLIQDRLGKCSEPTLSTAQILPLTNQALRQLMLWEKLIDVRKIKSNWSKEEINHWEDYIKHHETKARQEDTEGANDQAYKKIKEGRIMKVIALKDFAVAESKVSEANKGLDSFLATQIPVNSTHSQGPFMDSHQVTTSSTGTPASDMNMPSKPRLEPISSRKRKAQDLPADLPPKKRGSSRDIFIAPHLTDAALGSVTVTRGKKRSLEEAQLPDTVNKRQRVKAESQITTHHIIHADSNTRNALKEADSNKGQIENKGPVLLRGRRKKDTKTNENINLNKNVRREVPKLAHGYSLRSLSTPTPESKPVRSGTQAMAKSIPYKDTKGNLP